MYWIGLYSMFEQDFLNNTIHFYLLSILYNSITAFLFETKYQ